VLENSLDNLPSANGNGPVESVADFSFGVDTQAVEDGGDDVGGFNLAFHGEGGAFVGGAMDDAALDTATCEC